MKYLTVLRNRFNTYKSPDENSYLPCYKKNVNKVKNFRTMGKKSIG